MKKQLALVVFGAMLVASSSSINAADEEAVVKASRFSLPKFSLSMPDFKKLAQDGQTFCADYRYALIALGLSAAVVTAYKTIPTVRSALRSLCGVYEMPTTDRN